MLTRSFEHRNFSRSYKTFIKDSFLTMYRLPVAFARFRACMNSHITVKTRLYPEIRHLADK